MAILRNAFCCPRACHSLIKLGVCMERGASERRTRKEMIYYGAEITVPIPGPAMNTRNVVRDMVSSHYLRA